MRFLLSHGDTVTQVLRCGSPFLQPNYLKELQQLTAVVARATNQGSLFYCITKDLDSKHVCNNQHFYLNSYSRLIVIVRNHTCGLGNYVDIDRSQW